MPEVRDFLIGLLKADTEIIVTDDGTPIFRLMPVSDKEPPKAARKPDLYPTLWVSDDFDDLLPGEYWLKEQS